MNGVEQSRAVGGPDGRVQYIPTQKLLGNERLMGLRQALGLEFGTTYDTDAKVAALPYGGGVTFFVDEDVDGKGKIFPLAMAFIAWFWPELALRPGWITRLQTPVVRVYLPGKMRTLESSRRALVFYYEQDFDDWCAANPAETERARKEGRIKYFKGLAGHDSETEVPVIAETYGSNLMCFDTRGETVESLRRDLQLYLGKRKEDNLGRKAIIRSPPVFFTPAEIAAGQAAAVEIFGAATAATTATAATVGRGRKKKPAGVAASVPAIAIPIRRVLDVDAGLYKRSDVENKMPSVVDGFKVTSRKVLWTIIFEKTPPERKIFQLAGRVAEQMFFHKGDASLNATIVGLAQAFPGGREAPAIISHGEIGSRAGKVPQVSAGGKKKPCGPGTDAGSPRYVSVVANRPLLSTMFSSKDNPFITPVVEDGEIAQPEFSLPVLPLAIVETSVTLAEGWAWTCYARDLGDIASLLDKGLSAEHAPTFQAAAEQAYRIVSDVPPGAEGPDSEALEMAISPVHALGPLRHSTRGWGGSIQAVARRSKRAAGGAGGAAAATAGIAPPQAPSDPDGIAQMAAAPAMARLAPADTREVSFGQAYLLGPAGGRLEYWEAPTSEAPHPTLLRIVELPKWIGIEKFLHELQLSPDSKELSEAGRKIQSRLHERIAAGTAAENLARDQDTVHIEVPLVAGALEAALQFYPQKGDFAAIPSLFRALGLYSWVTPSLNFLGPNREVLEFGQNYHGPFLIWYAIRRAIFTERVFRQRELAALQVERLEEIVKFCRMQPDLRGETDEVAENRLRDLGFKPLDSSLLARLEGGLRAAEVPTDQIRARVTAPVGASLGGGVVGAGTFDFLRDLTVKAFANPAIIRREAELAKAKARLTSAAAETADPIFPGAAVWRREAAVAIEALKKGWANKWCD